MLVERKVIYAMIYNKIVHEHNRLFEEVTKTMVAPFDAEMTKFSDDKSMKKIDLDGRIKDIESHLESSEKGISQDRKDFLKKNLYSIDMIFDPMTARERAFLVNLKAHDMLQKSMRKRETSLGLSADVDAIIDTDLDKSLTFPPGVMGDYAEDDKAESTMPRMGGNRGALDIKHAEPAEDTMWDFGIENEDSDDEKDIYNDTTAIREARMSRGSLIRRKYYGRY
jgi:hypothetical protein